MTTFRFVYSVFSVVLCSVYNPFIRCRQCRTGRPPGLLMFPYSLGCTVITHYLIYSLLPRSRVFPSKIFQTVLCLLIQNYFSVLWSDLDDRVMLFMAKSYTKNEEIIHNWKITMVVLGLSMFALSIIITKCNKGHIIFHDGIRIRPWTHYWNRLTDKNVHFRARTSVIPNYYDYKEEY